MDRVPPQNLEMEQAVLGAMLVDPRVVDQATEIVRPADFYREAHRIIFECIKALADKSEPIDLLTVQTALQHREMLESCGGTPFLYSCMNLVVSPSNVGHYAGKVKEAAILRQIQDAARRMYELTHSEYDSIEAVTSEVERVVTEAMQNTAVREPRTMREIVSEAFEEIETWEREKKHVTGIPSGVDELDFLTRGFHPHDLTIIAARPGHGKSALAGQIAVNAAKHGVRTLFASLEMKDKQLVHRMIATAAQTDGTSIRTGYITSDDWSKIGAACSQLSELGILIDDQSDMSVERLKTICRREARRGLGLVIVDYLQLVKAEIRADMRAQEIDYIAHSLKGIAKSLNVPVIALAQLNRAVDERPDHTPKLSDLRESGGIEAEADVVIFPFNPAQYGPQENRQDFEPAKLIVGKARMGMTGAARTAWKRRTTEFVNIAKEYRSEDTTTRHEVIHSNGTKPTTVADTPEDIERRRQMELSGQDECDRFFERV